METRPKTIFCDIDGTLIEHAVPWVSSLPTYEMKILSGTLEKFKEWDQLGYNIILVTGRRESMRQVTENQLADVGIFYDQLIMGIGGGERILINDCKPSGNTTAYAINLVRNTGISKIEI